MKNMKNKLFYLLCVGTLLVSCTESIDMADRYTFQEESIASYLEKHDKYSEYVRLLSETPVSKYSASTLWQLLSARGHYTVFAPNNEAIHKYLDELTEKGLISEPSWEAFETPQVLDSIRRVIVFNSIIDSGDELDAYSTSSFPAKDGEEFAMPNMNDRKMTIRHGLTGDSIFVNTSSLISMTNRDIQAINGYIHEIHEVIAPSNETLGDLLNTYLDGKKEGFRVTAMMVRACGLMDTLYKVRDEVYEELYQTRQIEDLPKHWSEGTIGYVPEHRKYGFTIFAETDDFWQQTLGKEAKDITLQDIRSYIQAEHLCPGAIDDDNYTSVNNALNQFITYHMLPMRIPKEKLVIHYNELGYNYETSSSPSIPVWELYTTMGKRRLIKIYEALETNGDIYLNRFPRLDNGRQGTYHEIGCEAENEGVRIDITDDLEKTSPINGIIYPLNSVLAYTTTTRQNLQKQRLRFDGAGLFPEFMNNDIRIDRVGTVKSKHVGIPSSDIYPYLDDIKIFKETNFYYLSGFKNGWNNYQGDEINVIGNYEMTLRLPPVPQSGTYEIRYSVGAGVWYRSMCQIYFGTDPDNLVAQGLPLDFRIAGNFRWLGDGTSTPSTLVGWEEDSTDDDDYNAEVDKKMRANGFMKGPKNYTVNVPKFGPARGNPRTIRRIVVTSHMEPDQTYYIRFKSVLDNKRLQFYMDFIEFCAKEVYDNPYTPEDIW